MRLFEIGRSRDQNRIFYEATLRNDGNLNTDDPIRIYWKKRDSTEPLTNIQRKFAYGLVIDKAHAERILFHFVSYPKRKLLLSKTAGQAGYRVLIEYQGDWSILNDIFVQIDGGTFWVPKIANVRLRLMHPASCKILIENINPKKL